MSDPTDRARALVLRAWRNWPGVRRRSPTADEEMLRQVGELLVRWGLAEDDGMGSAVPTEEGRSLLERLDADGET